MSILFFLANKTLRFYNLIDNVTVAFMAERIYKMITIKDISKKYGKHVILQNISFDINPGDCVGIVGANGSGKTTLLSIICGVIKADSGKVLKDEQPFKLNKDTGYVPQENPLIPELTAFDNLRLWFHGSKDELKKEIESGMISFLGINDFINKPISKLSGGMKKRLSIAIALIDKPTLLVMDEPSAALDIPGKHQIKQYMDYYTKQLKGSILIASHDENELKVCNKLLLLKNHQLTPLDTDIKLMESLIENE